MTEPERKWAWQLIEDWLPKMTESELRRLAARCLAHIPAAPGCELLVFRDALWIVTEEVSRFERTGGKQTRLTVRELPQPTQIVHALHNGDALCGKRGPPGDWPSGHYWVAAESKENEAKVSCEDCRASLVWFP